MGGFANLLMNVLLGWMRGLADGVWKLIESPGAGGALAWFGKTWWLIALVLIGGGILVDWLVWLIRWQPYHIWATRLRRIRAFFSRAPVETVEATGVAAQGTARYGPLRNVETYRRPEPEWYEEEAVDPEPYVLAMEDEESYQEQYEEQYEEAYEEPYAEPYEEPYTEEGAGWEDQDPLAAYRRPAEIEARDTQAQSIPDAQLGNYPGRRYDPDLLPRLPRQAAVPDPLADYDAYDPSEVAEYERMQDGLPPIVDPRQAARETVWTDQPRRARRRMAREEVAVEPEAQAASTQAEVETAPTARRRRNRAAQQEPESMPEPGYEAEPIYEPEPEPRETGWNADWYEDWSQEPVDEEADGQQFEPLREPRPSKRSLAERVRKLGETPAEPKKRGKLAQMLDPQMEPIKGLPPRVDMQQAFRKPTLPQQFPPRAPRHDSTQWDDDT